MHTAIIIDEERLKQEQSMLNRLCIGLMTEGVHVTRIVSDTALPDPLTQIEQRIALAPRLEVPMRVLPWLRSQRTGKLVEQLEKTKPDVLYAVGARAWNLGIEVGLEMERPILIDVALPEHARTAPRPQQASPIAGYVTCTPWLKESLGQRVEPPLISVVPIGVALPSSPRTIMSEQDRPVAIAIIGSGTDTKSYHIALDAISRVWRDGTSLQVFLELRGVNDHELWRLASRLDLLSIVSVVGDASLHRTLMTDCDLLLLPEATGEPRSILLEAMAFGIPVVARRDPMLQSMLNDSCADLFEGTDASVIAKHISQAIGSRERASALGQRARTWVEQHHRSSVQVQELRRTLEQTLSGGAVRLRAGVP